MDLHVMNGFFSVFLFGSSQHRFMYRMFVNTLFMCCCGHSDGAESLLADKLENPVKGLQPLSEHVEEKTCLASVRLLLGISFVR